jgi:ubiquinone biosynthesis protein
MDIIKTGIGLGKTIKNVGRLREMASIFARHGFDEFITYGVTSKIPNFALPKSTRGIKEELKQREDREWPEVIGFRLRQCFEELGPAFIKFGQLLASREDLFDPAFIEEMAKLRDKVRAIPFSEVKEVFEQDLGQKTEDVFSFIEETPIGTASIGVVYRGELLSGEKVVVKVRRPHIEREIATDFSLLHFMATQTEKVSDEVRYLGVSRIIKDFTLSLQVELNFNIEAMNARRFKKNLEKHDTKNVFKIPEIYEQYSCETILVMEEMVGIPFSHKEKILPVLDKVQNKLVYGVELFMKTLLKDGFFHADLHGGNFFYLETEEIGLIDFGLMGALSKKSRKNFIAIIYALTSYDYENLVYEFLDVAEYEEIPDIDLLIQDVKDALAPFVGLTVQQTNFTLVLLTVIKALKKHRLYLPRDWYIVFRSLMTLDGVGRSIDLDLDLLKLFEKDIHEIIQDSFSKEDLIEEGIWSAKDVMSSARVFPRHFKWFLKSWSKKGYAFELIHSGHEKAIKSLSSSIVFLGHAFLSAVFFYSGVSLLEADVMTWRDVPIIVWPVWGLSLAFFIAGLKHYRRHQL